MAREPHCESEIHISPIDQRGRIIAPDVLEAACEIHSRVFRAVEKELGDPALAACLLEESAADVTQALRRSSHGNEGNIRNLRGYLFRSVVRRIDRLKAKRLPAFACSTKLPGLESFDPRPDLDLHLLIQELAGRCTVFIQKVMELRTQGYSWDEIGETLRVSPHSASTRYWMALQKLRAELFQERRGEGWPQALMCIRSQNGHRAPSHRRADKGSRDSTEFKPALHIVATITKRGKKKPCQSAKPAKEKPRNRALQEPKRRVTGMKLSTGVE